MANRRAKTPPRSPLSTQFDAMTLAIVVVLLGVTACSVLAFGPDEALDRIGCGLNGAVNGLLAYPRPCH